MKNSSSNSIVTALSLEEALDVIKAHEIEKTLRFSAYSSSKDFGRTGKIISVCNRVTKKCHLRNYLP